MLDKIKKVASERGYSQNKIAELTGMKQQAVNRLFNGKNSPTVTTLKKICDVLGMEIVLIEKRSV